MTSVFPDVQTIYSASPLISYFVILSGSSIVYQTHKLFLL